MKTKSAVLWILMAVFMSAHGVLALIEPGIINQVETGEWYLGWDPAQLLFGMSLFWIIPLWMAFLSVTLKGTANRWLNIIVGVVFTIINIWHITQPCCIMIHQQLVVLSTIIAAALVIYHAWMMPKKKD